MALFINNLCAVGGRKIEKEISSFFNTRSIETVLVVYSLTLILLHFYTVRYLRNQASISFYFNYFIVQTCSSSWKYSRRKLAGYRAFETYQNLDFRLTQFFPSMILNIPGFLIAENPKTIALTNAFLSVIAPLIALRVFLNETKLQLSPRLILFYFVPSVFLWGCFGLREYVVILFIVLALYFYTKKNFILCLIALFFVLISRPEYLVFAPLLIFFGINSRLNSIGKTLFFIVTILAVPLIVVMAVQYALNFTLAEVSDLIKIA